MCFYRFASMESFVDQSMTIEELPILMCLDPALQILEFMLTDISRDSQCSCLEWAVSTMLQDLRFYKMMFCVVSCEDSIYDWHLRFSINSMGLKLSQSVGEFMVDVEPAFRGNPIKLDELIHDLKEKILRFKPQVKEICIFLLSDDFKCRGSCQHNLKLFLEHGREIPSFIDLILQNINALLNSDIVPVGPLKQHFSFIQQKLKEFPWCVNSANHSITRVKKLNELMSRTQTWLKKISCLLCLYWIDGKDESLESTIGSTVSNFHMQKIIHDTPEFLASTFEGTIISQRLASYFAFPLKDFITNNEVEILRQGLVFLLSFVMNPPEEVVKDTKQMLEKIYATINELLFLIRSIHINQMRDNNSEAKFYGFLKKIDGIKAEVRDLRLITYHSWQLNSPKTNVMGFLDSLLGNLKKMLEAKVMFNHLAKHLLEMVSEELLLLSPSLQIIMDLQYEHEEIKTQIIEMVYNTDYVIRLCPIPDVPLWYSTTCLSHVIEDIKLIKTKIKNVETDAMYNKKKESRDAPPSRAMSSKIKGVFVGFKDVRGKIMDELLRGSKLRTIISISGSGGQGKTTLAESIYNDPQITHHFNKRFWCYVSKDWVAVELLIKIICGVWRDDVDLEKHLRKILERITKIISDVEKDDLADLNEHLRKSLEGITKLICDIGKGSIADLDEHLRKILKGTSKIICDVGGDDIADLGDCLRKSLKGKRYLIVMDDIWNIDVWRKIELSFPDDSNGSRILFTSRDHNVASEAREKSSTYRLPLFTNEESWEMIDKMLFHGYDCPPELLGIGKEIANDCKGLPLAVALIAGVLGRMEQTVDLWNEVAQNLKSHLAAEGCMNVIEVSYNYLLDNLKRCFLYFGAFRRGEIVKAGYLKLLWIAEGFIIDNKKQSLNDLANECVSNLVSLNLVGVRRTSRGEIKYLNVHGLLYDFCLEKVKEVNFLDWADERSVFEGWSFSPQKLIHHRLCIRENGPSIKSRPICRKKQLPTSQVHSLLLFETLGLNTPYFLESFKVVVVLDMKVVNLAYFPKAILSMVHLRYLALSGDMGRIPMSIDNLFNLETLIILNCHEMIGIPFSLWKITSLMYINIKWCYFLPMENFAENINSFAAYNIERFGCLNIVNDGMTEEFFRKLEEVPKLRKLKCFFCDDTYHPKFFTMHNSLKNLESLQLIRAEGKSEISPVLFEKLPTFNFFENLKNLSLWLLKLPWNVMSTIGKQLPNLEVLKLVFNGCEGSIWDLEDGDFPKLKYLVLSHLDIEEINVSACEDTPFPCLEHLSVEVCWELRELPSRFEEISTLHVIEVRNCSVEVTNSAWRIVEAQKDLGNTSLQSYIYPAPTEDDDVQLYSQGEFFTNKRRRRR